MASKILTHKKLQTRIFIALLIILVIAFATYVSLRPAPKFTTPSYVTINVEQARSLIDSNPSLIILDVRTEEEYLEEHLEGAKNIPLDELEERLEELDVERGLLVYCRSGGRSAQASEILARNGFSPIYNLEGGIIEWRSAGYPTIVERSGLTSFTSSSRTVTITSVRRAFPSTATFERIDGTTFQTSDFKGRITVLVFMSTGCKTCESYTGHLRELSDKYHSEIVIASISMHPETDTREILQNYMQENDAPWIWARDINDVGRTHLGIHSYPTTYILDPEGRIAFWHQGDVTTDILTFEIEELRAEH